MTRCRLVTPMDAVRVLAPRVAVRVASWLAAPATKSNVALVWSAGTVTVAGTVPASGGASASAIALPPGGAGMSRLTVNVSDPPAATLAAAGDSDARFGTSSRPI